jgi:hypothetical protein
LTEAADALGLALPDGARREQPGKPARAQEQNSKPMTWSQTFTPTATREACALRKYFALPGQASSTAAGSW